MKIETTRLLLLIEDNTIYVRSLEENFKRIKKAYCWRSLLQEIGKQKGS
jgi:hypothetical protein